MEKLLSRKLNALKKFFTISLSLLSTLIFFSTIILSSQPAKAQDDEDGFHIGGALRYNIYLQDYDNKVTPNDKQFTFDTWRINVSGQKAGVLLNFEYRFYPTFNTHFIHNGWIGYNFSDALQMQLGVSQVPFGNLTYASHNWWFVTPYYVGLEDDYDMGLKFRYNKSNWTVHVAYYMQPEPSGPAYGSASFGVGGSGRYSYDIIPITGSKPWDYVLGQNETPQSNQERDQINLRAVYNWKHGDLGNSKIGGSFQYGSLYNSATNDHSGATAGALHLNGNYGQFNVKAEYVYYNYDAKNDNGQDVDYTYMAAYGDPYKVATEANMYTLALAYSVPVDFGPISNITFYDDYTYTDKTKASYYDTQQNTLGFSVVAGGIYAYFDIASGKNQPWLTNNFGTGLGPGVKDPRLNTRFNINIGYYF